MLTNRQATLNDIELIRELADVTFRETYKNILYNEQLDWMFDWMYSAESLKQQMNGDGQVFLLVYKDNVPAGYISIERQGDDLFHFQKIYVLPLMQKNGIGKYLIDLGVEYIRSLGLEKFKVELNVNRKNPAVDFYQRLGFKIASEGDFPIGNGYYMNDYIMEKEFDS